MAWSASKIMMSFLEDVFENTSAIDLNSDSFKLTLWDNDVVPDQTAASASAAYATGQWVSAGNEVSDGTEWPVAGQALGSVTSTFASNVYTWDAADEVSDGTSATLVGFFGSFIYDDTIAAPVVDPGICYLYFGGTQTVTDGTLTVIFNALGIFTITA